MVSQYFSSMAVLESDDTIGVSSKFQRNDIIDFGIIMVLPSLEALFEAKKLVIAMLLKTKTWYLQAKSMEKIKTP